MGLMRWMRAFGNSRVNTMSNNETEHTLAWIGDGEFGIVGLTESEQDYLLGVIEGQRANAGREWITGAPREEDDADE